MVSILRHCLIGYVGRQRLQACCLLCSRPLHAEYSQKACCRCCRGYPLLQGWA